jgi:D-3-phosphoglycerate dehydrogenase
MLNNTDKPGIVGLLGTLLAKHKVNIASMSLSRDTAGGLALTVLSLDSIPPQAVLEDLKKDTDIINVKVITL